MIVLAFLTIALSNPASKQDHSYADQRCAEEQLKYAIARRNAVTNGEQAAPTDQRTDQTKDKEHREPDWCDLAAQHSMANSARGSEHAAWFSAGLTGIGVILIGFTLAYTRRTLDEAKATTKAAQDTVVITEKSAVRQLRAYVSTEPIQICNIGTAAKILLKYELVNHGQTPAKDVHQFSMMTIRPFPRNNGFVLGSEAPPMGPSKTICWPHTKPDYGIAEFPIILAPEHLKIILDGSHRIYFAIRVHYVDCFDQPRTSECFGSIRPENIKIASNRTSGSWVDGTFEYENEGNEYT